MSLERLLAEEKELEQQMFSNESNPDQNEETQDSATPPVKNVDTFDESNLSQQEPETAESTDEGSDRKKPVSWKQRFINYKTSTDKTISNLRKEHSFLSQKIFDYEKKIDDLSFKLAESSQKNSDPFAEVITEADIETIGPEAVDIVKKATKRATENAIDPIKRELEQLKARELSKQRKASEDRQQDLYRDFLSNLGDRVENLQSINVDPKFANYLDQIDSSTGERRLDGFKRAEAYMDADRVADYFIDFQANVPKSKKELLEQRVTPEGSKVTGDLTEQKQKRSWTTREVESFFNDVTKGVYKGRRKEADDMEAEITKAYMEGRIIDK